MFQAAAAFLLLTPGAVAGGVGFKLCGFKNSACCPARGYSTGGGTCFNSKLVCLGDKCIPCGMDGSPGCGNDGDICNNGLALIDGLCSTPPHPAPPPCGNAGEPACSGTGAPPCAAGLVEDPSGSCGEPQPEPTPCGDDGLDCCEGKVCNGHYLTCMSSADEGGVCVPCGGDGDLPCTEAGVSPCSQGLEIIEGLCGPPPTPSCGFESEVCCEGEQQCKRHSLTCDEFSICVACGKEGLNACTEDGVKPCDDGLTVVRGVCETQSPPPPPCGFESEVCCDGENQCKKHSLACDEFSICVACGKEGLNACTEDGVKPCGDGLAVVGGVCEKLQVVAECCSAEIPVCCSGTCITLEDAAAASCVAGATCCEEPGQETDGGDDVDADDGDDDDDDDSVDDGDDDGDDNGGNDDDGDKDDGDEGKNGKEGEGKEGEGKEGEGKEGKKGKEGGKASNGKKDKKTSRKYFYRW